MRRAQRGLVLLVALACAGATPVTGHRYTVAASDPADVERAFAIADTMAADFELLRQPTLPQRRVEYVSRPRPDLAPSFLSVEAERGRVSIAIGTIGKGREELAGFEALRARLRAALEADFAGRIAAEEFERELGDR